jgi:hypothetical protein
MLNWLWKESSMLKWLWKVLFGELIVINIPAPFNGEGFPPKELKWHIASKTYKIFPCIYFKNGFVCYEPPVKCTICNSVLIEAKHDRWKIEDVYQYMVLTFTCPNGHGYYCEWA